MSFQGACHCGRIEVSFEATLTPGEIEVRACQCGFCRRHNGKTVSDPKGRVEFRAAAADITRYRFGTRSADFLLCAGCGTYMGAVAMIEGGLYGIANVSGAGIAELEERPTVVKHYAGETAEAKAARRRRIWSPAAVTER